MTARVRHAAAAAAAVLSLAACSGGDAADGAPAGASAELAEAAEPVDGPAEAPAGDGLGAVEGYYTLTWEFSLTGEREFTGTTTERFAGTCAEDVAPQEDGSFTGDVGGHDVRVQSGSGDLPGSYALDVGTAAINLDGTSWAGAGRVDTTPDGSGVLTLEDLGGVTSAGSVTGTVRWTCQDG